MYTFLTKNVHKNFEGMGIFTIYGTPWFSLFLAHLSRSFMGELIV